MPSFDSDYLRVLRERRELSQDQVGTAIGRSVEVVEELESGVVIPCIVTLAALADTLGDELLDDEHVLAIYTDGRSTDLGPDTDAWMVSEDADLGEMTDDVARHTSAAMFPVS